MKSNNLDKLRKEFTKIQELLAIDTDNWDPRTKPGMIGKQNAAKVRLQTVRSQLALEVLKASNTILVTRDFEKTGDIVESAQKNNKKNILLDFLSLEKDMFANIFAQKKNSLTFNSEAVGRMNTILAAVGERIGAASMPMILVSSEKFGTVPGRAEMITKMEAALDATFGFDLKPLYLNQLIEEGIFARLDQNSLNVIIVNVPLKFTKPLHGLTGSTQVLTNESVAADAANATDAKPARTRRAAQKQKEETLTKE